ncbi:uncharacterized protein LOC144434584 isoform X2 [Glandiceps talaboti]
MISLVLSLLVVSQCTASTLYFTPGEVQSVLCPDGQSQCPDGNTCCVLSSGKYGCCPLPKAVCCSDHLHCCPSGTTCDVSAGKCNKGDFSMDWVQKREATSVNSILCPDGQSQCPDGDTCCQLTTGQWGCCPLPKAVCCSDHLHCCPSGTTCDVSEGKCNKGDFSMDWVQKREVISVNSILCPDGQSQCPDGDTCCQLTTGQWGCCPLPKAVCCSDHLHCCPSGTTCDVSEGKCNKGDFSMDWVQKHEATSVNAIVCPDGQSQCPDSDTCCQLTTGQWGCCPLPKAVCCSDHLHCCPSGTTCDVSGGKCNKGDFSMDWVRKTSAAGAIIPKVTAVECSDNKSQCPDGNTCCKTLTGQYGCCPLPNAVCCPNQNFCCPSGTTCDAVAKKCVKGELSFPWLEKEEAVMKVLQDNICPDQKSKCPEDSTCCILSTGLYGCCPLPKAVCCTDKLHCCPEGTTCDVPHSKCNKGDLTFPWVEKTQAKSVSDIISSGNDVITFVDDVVCPGEQQKCPDGNTCCNTIAGFYGCCPFPDAVCCADEQHCCPSGSECDLIRTQCNKNDGTAIPMVKKTAAAVDIVTEVTCPDGSSCPSGNTCCKLSTGQYGCCPLPSAVCCSDGLHCCPSGYKCDVSAGTCLKGNEALPWLEKLPATPPKVDTVTVTEVPCPDGSFCPDGNTCCKLSTGQYGCCPLPSAVCCSDGLHCCPSGYKCDVSAGTCLKGNEALPWLEKLPATPPKVDTVTEVPCPDGSFCPDGNTCCKLSTGQYGCCPLPSAVCCSDGLHCCPSGYKCDVSAGTCLKGNEAVPWLEKLPATPPKVDIVTDVTCPDGSSCPSGNTCCKLSTGQYGCCPLPSAVCCSDGLHCCPSGYKCDVSAGTCLKGNEALPWLEKLPATPPKSDLSDVVCPGGLQQCPKGFTCCPSQTIGFFGCCPFQNAVCCQDKVHCCPNGFKCSESKGTMKCYDGDKTLPTLTHIPATSVSQVEIVTDVTCPDGSSCPSGNTCCKLSTGQYGCCPLPSAVCCSDGLHCCPSGYKCDVSAGTCLKGNTHVLPWVEKQPALRDVRLVTCPDERTKCPDKNTCCEMPNGQFACCPIEKAICCEDKLHCCPDYMKCDIKTGKCIRGAMFIPWFEKTPGLVGYVDAVMCPDQSQCPDGNTCCKLASGQYGCCPLPQAECCSDGVHCCPSGYTCDVKSGTCSKSDVTSVVPLV